MVARHYLQAVLVLAAFAPASTCLAQASFFEGFDNVGPTNGDGPDNLITQGWAFTNQSEPEGVTVWYQGTQFAFPSYVPQAGSGYLANTASWDDGNRIISTWAVLPSVANQTAGDVIALYMTGGMSSDGQFQIRYSPGGGTNTGSGAQDVGDFTQLLAQGLAFAEFGNWLYLSAEVPGNGRLALRWYNPGVPSFQSPHVAIDSLSVGPPPCNAPLAPGPGQTVTWTAADSPYRVCSDLTIPATATVNVEPGVQVDFDAGFQLFVNGTLRLEGAADNRISFEAAAVFPPMIEVTGGVVEASFADFGGQLRVQSGATILLTGCGFAGNGLLWSQELQAVAPFIHLNGCTFSSSQMSLSDATVVLEDNTFNDTAALILRGSADVTAPNTFIGRPLQIIRERQQIMQPMFVDGAHASGVSSGAGLVLEGGTYLLGANNVLQNNLYTLDLGGGLLPDSSVPTTGNTINAIDVGSGGFMGRGRWPNLGLPYRLTAPTTSLPGGHLTIDPGVIVEAADPGAAMRFRSTRHGVLEGLPDAPITFRGLSGQSWDGLLFHVNSSTGCRLEYCVVEDADFGVISTDNTLYVDNCLFTDNTVGGNTNTFGNIFFRKTRFQNNATGVSLTDSGSPTLASQTNPNAFEGNGAGIDATELNAQADARHCWWGDPSGPQAPGNPAGQGDPIVGPGAGGIAYSPFLTAPPDFGNTPPVVRMIEPGLTQLYASPDYGHPDYLLDPGTKYILRWDVQSDDAVVNQRIEFSPDGHYPSRFTVIADGLPGDARSLEITVPDAGFAVTNQPQFLRIVAVDTTGQEAWDQAPLLVPSGRITGNLTITTDLSGQTFTAGQPIPDMQWTGSANFGTVRPLVVLEADGAAVLGLNVGGQGVFFEDFPIVSTDTARLALQVRNNSNDAAWFFADGYFSIRHDPRLGFSPPSVNLISPLGGENFGGGTTVPIMWTATAPEGLRSFDIQASYDAGRTWHPIVRDLPGTASGFDWPLPPSEGIADVRVRVIARDQRFQNSSATSDAFTITPGSGGVAGDLDGDGDVDLDDFGIFAACYNGANNPPAPSCPPGVDADLDGDGDVDLDDFAIFAANYTGSL